MTEHSKNELSQNLQRLQDLKFLIYIGAHHQLNFHCFNITTIELPNQHIDLVAEYQRLIPSHSIEEVAKLIILKYDL